MATADYLDTTFVHTWMLIRASNADMEPSSLRHMHPDFVRCRVEKVHDSPTVYTLYISASVSNQLDVPASARTSPVAFLDQYITDSALAAPGWVHWKETRFFENSRASFIGMFVEMALWSSNLATPKRANTMIEWAQMISAGTWAESQRLGPATPLRPTMPRNTKQRRSSGVGRTSAEIIETPTRVFKGDLDSDDLCDGDQSASEVLSATEYALQPLLPLLS
ncbi:hypothetical protein MVEN_00877000 [Mycena venus]|uniref:Uncharacterized protein n=1 Tax=Mycena venus TaxID=2733690 RepID=A0A8H6YHD1_9AGAR|nr:hypothetical protein MVEN_00877000 [Mycena venus]